MTFTFVAVAISFAQAWLPLKSDSAWPPIFLHASHNQWMKSIFTPLAGDREYTKWVAGDLGWRSLWSLRSSRSLSGLSAVS
jgi:uncharacterized protein